MAPVDDPRIYQLCDINEHANPTPRKDAGNGRWIYESRPIEHVEAVVESTCLCDFGEAIDGRKLYTHTDVQPDVYRAPEVMLGVPWSYPIDIWNLGCVIWQIAQTHVLLVFTDHVIGRYSFRSHLRELIRLLGPPPKELLARGKFSSRYFSPEGDFNAYKNCNHVPPPPKYWGLEDREAILSNLDDEEDKDLFLQMMRKMLEWDPEKRHTAKQLLEDEWLKKHTEA
ncbi:hypothetical protein H0H93_003092 [Arthromyces matolae]|nr:hypothetical protein H0H93_003092 [Arthromyces matolae]